MTEQKLYERLIFPLESLIKDENLNLFDTNIFMGYLPIDGHRKKGRFEEEQETFSFARIMNDYLRGGAKIYTTSHVLGEIEVGTNYALKKRINSLDNQLEHQRELLELMRMRKQKNSEMRKMVTLFRELGKIVSLSEEEGNNYLALLKKYQETIEEYQLSETDADLLLSSIALTKSGSHINLMSNDFNIVRAFRDIIRSEKNLDRMLSFFVRRSFSGFEMLEF